VNHQVDRQGEGPAWRPVPRDPNVPRDLNGDGRGTLLQLLILLLIGIVPHPDSMSGWMWRIFFIVLAVLVAHFLS
jgi:hypothetical protein